MKQNNENVECLEVCECVCVCTCMCVSVFMFTFQISFSGKASLDKVTLDQRSNSEGREPCRYLE